MSQEVCQKCGHLVAGDVQACPQCGHALKNGTFPPWGTPLEEVLSQEDIAELLKGKIPKKLGEWVIATHNEEEYIAALREYEETGGKGIEDVIEEIDQMVKDRE
jgi:hypothetical protein